MWCVEFPLGFVVFIGKSFSFSLFRSSEDGQHFAKVANFSSPKRQGRRGRRVLRICLLTGYRDDLKNVTLKGLNHFHLHLQARSPLIDFHTDSSASPIFLYLEIILIRLVLTIIPLRGRYPR